MLLFVDPNAGAEDTRGRIFHSPLPGGAMANNSSNLGALPLRLGRELRRRVR